MIKLLINEKMAFWFIWFGVDSGAGSPPVENSPIPSRFNPDARHVANEKSYGEKQSHLEMYFISILPTPLAISLANPQRIHHRPWHLVAEPSEILPRNTTVASFTNSQDGLFYRFYTA